MELVEDRRPSPKLTLWVFGSVARQTFLQGLEQGGKYGVLYGIAYGAFPIFLGIPYGFGLGLMYGLIVGAVLGMVDGLVLGTYSVIWFRVLGRPLKESHRVPDPRFRLNFIWIIVVITTLGSVLLFPVVLRAVPPNLWDNSSLASVTLDLMPSLIAGFAAYRAGENIVLWCATNVPFPEYVSAMALPKRTWKMPPVR